MNRSQRRANRRRLLAGLRASGCRCSPTITPDPGAPDQGYVDQGQVEHEAHCPMLLRLAMTGWANPTLIFRGVKDCER